MFVMCKAKGVIRDCGKYSLWEICSLEICNVYLITELLSRLSKLDHLWDSSVGTDEEITER